MAEAVDAFYASRGGAPLWLRGGGNSSAANELIGILQRAPLDGFASGPALALQAQMLAGRASTGDPTAFANADRLLSTAWVMYVQTLQTPLAGMTYADSWVQPRRDTPLRGSPLESFMTLDPGGVGEDAGPARDSKRA